MAVHELKTWPVYFDAVKDGSKTFECRQNDRGFKVGDILVLQEYYSHQQSYSGNIITVEVTYILGDEFVGVASGYVVMAIKVISEVEV